MRDFSMIEKFKIFVDIIMSSPLFLCCFMLGIAFLIFYIRSILANKKINKWAFICVWGALATLLMITYNKVIINLVDNLFDTLFMALYFPNLSVYIVILLVANFFLIYSIFKRNTGKSYKIINVISALTIDSLLLLIIDIVNKNNINVYDEINVYTNSNLLVLLELTTAVFTSWLLINLLITAYHKLKKFDKKNYPEMPEIIFD